MRIIAGEYRGRTIKAPKGEGTRPTTDRVREALMSAVSSARGGFEGAVVLDAFAGSGALGLEALSRGAQSAQFCERDGATVRVVESNVKALGFDARQARVRKLDVLKDPPSSVQQPFDLVFLDPPYACNPHEVLGMVSALAARGSLALDAVIVYEHARTSNNEVDAAADSYGLSLASRKKYGDTVVDIMIGSPSAQENAASK